MMRALVLMIALLTSGCFTALFGTVSGISAASHNRSVREEPPRRELVIAVPPTAEEREACERDRTRISAAALAAHDANARLQLLSTMPNCLALGQPARVVEIPGKRAERYSVDKRIFAGIAIGLVIDALVVVLVASTFEPGPH